MTPPTPHQILSDLKAVYFARSDGDALAAHRLIAALTFALDALGAIDYDDSQKEDDLTQNEQIARNAKREITNILTEASSKAEKE